MSTAKMIRVIVKEPNHKAFEARIPNELRVFQRLVYGHIETFPLLDTPRVTILCNEEGKLQDLPYNCTLRGEHFVGTIVLAGEQGEDFADCPLRLDAALATWQELKR